MRYWIYKRTLLLLAAFGGVSASASLLPDSPIWSFSSFLGEVLFSPFKLLLAVLLFVLGFLSYSIFVRDVVKIGTSKWVTYSLGFPKLIFIIISFISILYLIFKIGTIAFIALVLALWYGIMDVGLKKLN
ncbi:hypothetical protein [Halalkalibacter krulwichiae]|uniref:Uncharacterized protein n=1 Tax=Halalkalibacter krulwichiae TaxID=199441 RepID=A0A1X9MDS7_9BACI|nr:hypothetical protein [Halalkalibacter krulwichiae]ARK30273.1 hypothetical protein BkAM31D_10800 [Halalkalibacter krulwichiae]